MIRDQVRIFLDSDGMGSDHEAWLPDDDHAEVSIPQAFDRRDFHRDVDCSVVIAGTINTEGEIGTR
ncbi:MAG: hypothetical protein GYA24_24635 [Candidatus Lokiarchaeota archaeon]|nr:hypothetical protein [Candidatus Lokiarchaeota archaeon]